MRYSELKFRGKTYTSQHEINDILYKEGFYWLIDSEIENAQIEIHKDTLVWHGGSFLSGDWHYGIFKNGDFFGDFHNGIWENGNFGGKWQSGINLTQDIKK
jgi:hypothetical protein